MARRARRTETSVKSREDEFAQEQEGAAYGADQHDPDFDDEVEEGEYEEAIEEEDLDDEAEEEAEEQPAPEPTRRGRGKATEKPAEDEAGVGHNSQAIAGAQLRAYLERIERLNEETKTIAEDRREVFAEAKANGFDTKTLRVLVKLRSMDPDERAEAEANLDLYKAAIGMR